MDNTWLELVERLLRPERPRLESCLRESEPLRRTARIVAQERTRALEHCQGRIEAARAAVFAADDGVIPARMTDLEREWRTLSRSDPERGLMDLWARIAPASWLDRKRWRHSDPSAMLDAASALAADVNGVEDAEAAVAALRVALGAWGVPIGSVIRWRAFDEDTDCVRELLAEPLRAALEAVTQRHTGSTMLQRAQQVELSVHAAALERFPTRPLLARSVGHAALVDSLFHAAVLADRPNPVKPLRALWNAGYALATVAEAGVTLELPPLT